MALGERGAISAPHLLAAEAGLDVLKTGGNAVDAAVASAAVSAVVQPFTSSFAGVGWATVYDRASGTTDVVRFGGFVPALLEPTELPADAHTRLVDWRALERTGRSLLGTLVPAAVAGWQSMLARWGTFGLDRALERAQVLAAEGFPVSPLLAEQLAENATRLARWSTTARIFLPHGRPLAAGERLVQSDLGRTIGRIAQHGADELATGPLATEIVRFFADHGGALSADDLAAPAVTWHEPLATRFRDYRVLATPGALGDVAFVAGLGLLDRCGPFTGPTDPEYIHTSVEVAKLVAAERERFLGADTTTEVAHWLVSPGHLDELSAHIGPAAEPMHRAAQLRSEDTITLAVVDRFGNAVHLMQTVGRPFGTGAVIGGTGMLANSSLYFAYVQPGAANRVLPGRGIEQNPCLASVFDATGRLVLVIGSPGGKTRVETVRQMLANVIDFHMNPQQAVDARRFLVSADGSHVEFEERYGPLGPGLDAALAARGHRVRLSREVFGSGQAIAVDPATGTRFAAADWRRESIALAY